MTDNKFENIVTPPQAFAILGGFAALMAPFLVSLAYIVKQPSEAAVSPSRPVLSATTQPPQHRP